MKILLILMTAFLMQVSASTYAQKITLNEKKASLISIFEKINKQSGVDFLVNIDLLAKSKPVNIDVKDEDLSIVLEKIFDGQPLDYVVNDRAVVVTKKTPGFLDRIIDRFNAIDVRGRVVDSEGQPLPGASVKVKGVNKVTSTNGKGEFYLEGVDENAVLVVSFIGYVTKEVAGAGTTMGDIRLEIATSDLEEVKINKGYYNTIKVLNTGAVNTIKADEIAKQPVSDVLMALEGKIPGLYISQASGIPGAELNVNLRGKNSLANGTAPLYIVDGIPFNSNSLSQNQNAADAKLSPFISIRPEDIARIDVLKDADATAIYGSRGANGVILITTKKGTIGKTKADVNVYSGIGKVTKTLDLMNTAQYLAMREEAFKNDNATPQGFDHDVNGDWDKNRYTDWQKILIGGSARFTNASATLSGGNEHTQFLFGTSYRKESTIFPGDYNNQIGSANLNVQHSSENNKFHADISVNYSNNNNRLPFTDFASMIYLPPNAPALYNTDGTLNWQKSSWSNPFGLLQQKSISVTDNLISNVVFSYNLFKDLQLKSNFGYSLVNMNEVNINPFSRLDPTSSNAANRRQQIRATNHLKSWIIEPQVNYSKSFDDHHIDALVGATFQSNIQDALKETATGFSSDEIIENFSAGTTISGVSSNNTVYKYIATFARIGYNFKEKYVINLTGRRDGSSRFGPGKRFGNFGAIGAAWAFSKESFISEFLPFLSFGKLRGSIGKTGNDQLQDYQYLSTFTPGFGSYFGVGILYPSNLTNPLYGWETINKIEGALDLGFFQDKVLFSFSYYRNRTANQLVGYSLPVLTGFSTVIANLPAVIENKGIELELSSVNVKKQDFSWKTNFNLSVPKNKLVSYPNITGSSYAATYSVGQPMSSRLNYEYSGIDIKTGIYTFKDQNGDNVITSSKDRVPKFYGQKYYGGLNNSLSYNGFTLDFMFQFVKQIGYSQDINTMAGLYYQNQPISVLDHWIDDSHPGIYQKYSQSYAAVYTASSLYDNSDARRTDASYIRLKNVMLSWSVPNNMRKRLKLQNLRIYTQGQNLWTLTNFKGIDPETAMSSGSIVRLPSLRLFTLGLQITL